MWLWDVFPHDQIWVLKAILWENGGTWSVTRNPQPSAESHSDVTMRCVLRWSDVSVEPFWYDCGIGSHMISCKCRAFPQMIVGVSYHVDGCKCWAFPHMIVGVSYHANGCKCWAFSQMVVGVSYHAGGCKCWVSLSNMDVGGVPPMVRCECWAFLTWMQDVFLPWSDVSARQAFLKWMQDMFRSW